MVKYIIFWVLFAFSVTGCTTAIQREAVDLGGGVIATYVTGKVAGDGQEAVFRDAFVDGRPVISHFHGGQSLPGQLLHGTVAAGMIAGGMVGASALRRPDKYINTESSTVNANDNSSISQGQGQLQGQAQKASAGASATAVSASSSKSGVQNKNVIQVKPGVIQQGGNGSHGNNGGGNGGGDGSPNGKDDENN